MYTARHLPKKALDESDSSLYVKGLMNHTLMQNDAMWCFSIFILDGSIVFTLYSYPFDIHLNASTMHSDRCLPSTMNRPFFLNIFVSYVIAMVCSFAISSFLLFSLIFNTARSPMVNEDLRTRLACLVNRTSTGYFIGVQRIHRGCRLWRTSSHIPEFVDANIGWSIASIVPFIFACVRVFLFPF